MMTIPDRIEALVRQTPGLTEDQLAEHLFPDDPYQQRVNSSCRRLLKQGRVKRMGKGGRADPYRYFIPGRTTHG